MAEGDIAEGGRSWIAYGDLMRVYACIAVVTLHTCAVVWVYRGISAPGLWSLNHILNSICRWAVPVFVLVTLLLSFLVILPLTKIPFLKNLVS